MQSFGRMCDLLFFGDDLPIPLALVEVLPASGTGLDRMCLSVVLARSGVNNVMTCISNDCGQLSQRQMHMASERLTKIVCSRACSAFLAQTIRSVSVIVCCTRYIAGQSNSDLCKKRSLNLVFWKLTSTVTDESALSCMCAATDQASQVAKGRSYTRLCEQAHHCELRQCCRRRLLATTHCAYYTGPSRAMDR